MTNTEKFNQIINENVAAGFKRGITIFTENLEEDLNKQEVFENTQIEDVIDFLMEDFIEQNK